MGAGASLKESQTDATEKSEGDSGPAVQDSVPDPLAEEEAFYQEHREELQEMLHFNQAKLHPRSEGGVGLLNQGATCYMNSLLQSLFNIPEFRMAVYQFEYLPELHGDSCRCIPLQLQCLFAELQLSQSSAASTKELTIACGFTGRDAMEQHDVQELCRVLFDALERSSAMLAEVIRDLYSGKVTYYTRSAEEHQGRVYESRRPASYMDLQVPIQDCKSLEEALRELVKPTLLSGDNQWFCEDLGEKVDAFIGTTIDTLPKILCLQLLRFVFDMQLMRRKKLSDSLAIPLELDVSCLGHEGSYELSAVCLHSGTAHGGHYHAFLRDQSGVWKDANDCRVQILGQRQCEALFAAEASGPVLYSSDAYFLLYRKTGMPTVDLQVVPPRLSRPILAENQRLTPLQRAFELSRRLVEVKVHLPSSAPHLQRRYVGQLLAGLVEEEVATAQIPTASFSILDGRPEKIRERALKSFAELDRKDLDLQALSSARLWHFDPLRGVPKGPFLGASSGGYGGRVELVLQTQGPELPCAEPHTGELLLLVLWPSGPQPLSLQHTTTVPWYKVKPEDESCKALQPEEPEGLEGREAHADASDDELPDIFDSAMPVRPGPKAATLADVRRAAAERWKLPLEATVLVALTGMQAGQEIEGDEVTLQECGLSPDDILCVERFDGAGALPALPRARQLYELKRNTAQMFFNHPDRPEIQEEFPPITISKDATLAQLKAQIADSLSLESKDIHLAKTRDEGNIRRLYMFKDEDRTLRQVGLGDSETIFVGHGAPCDPNERILRVVRYSYENGHHKVSDGVNFPARGDMSVRSLKEALIKACLHWMPKEVTWKRLRLRGGQPGKQYAVLREERRKLRSALVGLGDGRQVAVQLMEEEEELGPDDLLLLVRPWRVVEARLHAPTEMVVSKNQPLVEFQAMLTERYKGLLQDGKDEADKENQPENLEDGKDEADKENQPENLEDGKDEADKDKLEICVAYATGPPMTIQRCETLKWSESRLSGVEMDVTLADLKELRDGATLIVRSRAAALRGAQVARAVKGGKGPSKGSQAARKGAAGQGTQPTVMVATAKGHRAERSLVIQVAQPEADEPATETPGGRA